MIGESDIPASSAILPWLEIDQKVRAELCPRLASDPLSSAARWQIEFRSNEQNCAGLMMVFAAMSAADVWSEVDYIKQAWGGGIYFQPKSELTQSLNSNPKFIRIDQAHLIRRWSHHRDWSKSWMQRNVPQVALHIGILRQAENGRQIVEAHLDFYNSQFNDFSMRLFWKHLSTEILSRESHSPEQFEQALARQGINTPRFRD